MQLIPFTLIGWATESAQFSVSNLAETLRQELDLLAARVPASPCLLITTLANDNEVFLAEVALDAGWQVGVVSSITSNAPSGIASCKARILAHAAWVRAEEFSSENHIANWLAQHGQAVLALGPVDECLGDARWKSGMRIFRHGPHGETLGIPVALPVRVLEGSSPGIWLEPQPAGMPSEGELLRWDAVVRNINRFNSDSLKAWSESSKDVSDSLSWLGTLPGEMIPDTAERAGGVFSAADAIARNTQARRGRVFNMLLAIGVAAIFFDQLYSGPAGMPGLLLVSVLIGLAGLTFFRVSRGWALEERYLDYRALAEACRVQRYWSVAGIHHRVTDYFLRDQRDELEWIRRALSTNELGVMEQHVSGWAEIEHVRKCWIEDQLSYFTRPGKGAVMKNSQLAERWNRLAERLFMFGLTLTLIVLIFHLFFADAWGDRGDAALQVMIFAYSIAFAAAGLCKFYSDIQGYEPQAQRYRSSALLFDIAQTRLKEAEDAGDLATAQKVIFDMGREALDENGDWLILHRDRPVQIPLG